MKKQFTKDNILQAIGVLILFVSIIMLLSPFTKIYAISYWMLRLGGFAVYYFFFPLLAFIGINLIAKGKLGKALGWNFFLGAVLIFFGLGIMFGNIVSALGVDGLSNARELFKETYINKVSDPKTYLFVNDIRFSVGILFANLVILLETSVPNLPLILFLSLIIVGLIIAFIRPIVAMFKLIARRSSQKKAKKDSENEIQRRNEEINDDIASSIREEVLTAGIVTKGSEKQVVEEDAPLPSRLAANREHPKGGYDVPTENDIVMDVPDISEISSIDTGAMTTALFVFDDEEATPTPIVTKTQEVKEEPVIPEPETIAPEPVFVPTPEPSFAPSLEETTIEEQVESMPVVEEIEPLEESIESEIDDLLEEDMETFEPAPAPKVEPVVTPSSPAPQAAPNQAKSEEEILEETMRKLHQEKLSPLPPYVMPSTELLNVYENDQDMDQIEAECNEVSRRINMTFQDLGVGAKVVDHTIGPSVTRYDVQPDPSVSVASIGKFMKDVSMRLGGVAVRFEEIVRGKSTAGIEIPNVKATTVSLKEMVEANPNEAKYSMHVPFGKSISGDCISQDLRKFPHLLVAGTTGSGKSIFMHGLIMSLIMKNRPEDLKIVLIDPKRVEMSKYKNLPHLLCPIIKEPSEAKVCMDKLIEEMERRNKIFEACDVRDIAGYNGYFAESHGYKKLPYIVVLIDEYADLSDSCKTLGESVVRIAQKARSAGIHLVIATQRPTVQVITGTIKANIPVRVALSVASSIDSQTIIGQGGAEELNGYGDMLVDCSLITRVGLTRAQGCFVDEFEIDRVVKFIKGQNLGTMYDENFLDLVDHEAEAKMMEAQAPFVDPAEIKAQSNQDFYENVKEAIMPLEYASISLIQRKFNVGFTRAGKLFSQLQKDGIVALAPDSPSSSKGCRVLVHENPNDDLSDIKLGRDN
ncbi:MAG: DUF87 domain-containing protein [Bacilli bacterium]|nr:DUF87 domain-containing protein [Bacilli bacterium]